jgi:hypothetical protein
MSVVSGALVCEKRFVLGRTEKRVMDLDTDVKFIELKEDHNQASVESRISNIGKTPI